MLEQRDHRGKRFSIGEDPDEAAPERRPRTEGFEGQIEHEIRELERARAVAGLPDEKRDGEVLER